MQLAVNDQGLGWAAEMAGNGYVKTLMNEKAHTSDDLQWKRGPTTGLNGLSVSCCVSRSDLNTSMREELERITSTITEPLIECVCALAIASGEYFSYNSLRFGVAITHPRCAML